MQVAELLRKVPAQELGEIQLFLESAFHNRGPFRNDVLELFRILVKTHPEIPDAALEKNLLYPQLFPGKEPVAGKLEKTVSELNKLVREYLLWKYQQSEEQQPFKALYWARVLRQMNLPEKADAQLAKAEKEYFQLQGHGEKEYFYKYLIAYDRYSWANLNNSGRGDLHLEDALAALSDFYEVFRLEMVNKLLIQQRITPLQLTPFTYGMVHRQEVNLIDPDKPLIRINRLIQTLLLQESPSPDDFIDLLNDVKAVEDQIQPKVLRNIYAHVRNFCTILYNAQHEALLPVLHQIQRENLEKGYLFIEGQLYPTAFLNITLTALTSGQVEWAASFIEQYAHRILGEDEQRGFYYTNKALCFFHQKEYDKALEVLPTGSGNIYYHLLARRLEIMCYYETRSDLADYKLEAFKMYLRRASEKVISASLLEANMAFATLLQQIQNLPKGDTSRYNRVLKKLDKKSQIADSRWLLAKLKEMK